LSIRGHRELELIADLARGDMSMKALGEKYGRSHDMIQKFRQIHAERIQSFIDTVGDHIAGMWIAQKHARIAEYQADVDKINDEIMECERNMVEVPPALYRSKQNALQRVGEELGQVKALADVSVTYTVNGVNTDDLR
jgi:hypothetical protein